MKKIDYKNPIVSSFLLIGGISLIIGFSEGFFFFGVGVLFIYMGIRKNQEVS